MAKVINAMSKTATAAAAGPRGQRSKKSKVKLATHTAMGALSGLMKEVQENHSTLEADFDKAIEKVENIEYAMEADARKLSAAGAQNTKTALANIRKLQKSIAKNMMAMRKAAEKAEAEFVKGTVADAEPAAESEPEDGDE